MKKFMKKFREAVRKYEELLAYAQENLSFLIIQGRG